MLRWRPFDASCPLAGMHCMSAQKNAKGVMPVSGQRICQLERASSSLSTIWIVCPNYSKKKQPEKNLTLYKQYYKTLHRFIQCLTQIMFCKDRVTHHNDLVKDDLGFSLFLCLRCLRLCLCGINQNFLLYKLSKLLERKKITLNPCLVVKHRSL